MAASHAADTQVRQRRRPLTMRRTDLPVQGKLRLVPLTVQLRTHAMTGRSRPALAMHKTYGPGRCLLGVAGLTNGAKLLVTALRPAVMDGWHLFGDHLVDARRSGRAASLRRPNLPMSVLIRHHCGGLVCGANLTCLLAERV